MQAESVRHDLIYVGATRAYLLLHTDPGRALELADAAARKAMSVLDRGDVNPIVLAYYLRCSAVRAAAQHVSGHVAPEPIENALAFARAHGSAESAADISYQVILLSALGRARRSAPPNAASR